MSVFSNAYVQKNLYVTGTAEVSGNLTVDGNLNVAGTTTAVNSTNVNIKDKFLYLNKDYTLGTGVPGGLAVNYGTVNDGTVNELSDVGTTITGAVITTTGTATYDAGQIIKLTCTTNTGNNGIYQVNSHIGTALTVSPAPPIPDADAIAITLYAETKLTKFTAGTTAASSLVSIAGQSLLAANDIIQISGAINETNNGIFVISGITEGELTIASVSDPYQNTFVVDATTQAAYVRKVNISVINTSATGAWETSFGSTTAAVSTTNKKTIALAGGAASFTRLTLTAGDNQLTLGDNATINAPSGGIAGRIYSIPNDTGSSDFVMTVSNQTVGGVKTFTDLKVSAPVINTVSATALTADPAPVVKPITQFNTSGGVVTATLPTVAAGIGRTYHIHLKTAGNNLNITPNGAETIDGVNAALVLSIAGQHVRLTSDGTNWLVG